MQIMNLDEISQKLWWILTAYKTIDELPDAVMFIGYKGEIKNYNKKAQELFALDSDDFAPVNINEVIKDGMKNISESLTKSRPILATASIPGRDFYVELNVSKRWKGYCLSIRDLTRLTNEIFNEEKIIKFNGEKNAMLSKLENEFKSPVTSISGFSKGLLDGLGGELTDKQTKYIKIINNNAEELYHFLDKFLEFSKAESSIYESDYHNFDIIEVFKAIIKDLENDLEDKKLGFDFNYDGIEKRTVYADLNAVKTILRNILEVAVSMTETGYISVKLSYPDEKTCTLYKLSIPALKQTSYLRITIRDTGTGIPEEDMKYLCEPYAQLEKGKKNFLRAIKLGTASILVKRADGMIDIISEVMKGTRYDIILPIEKE